MSYIAKASHAIQAQKNIDLNRLVNERGFSTEWFYFCRIKDTKKAFIRFDRIKAWAADFNVSPQTLKLNLEKMVELKWATRCNTGYIHTSWKSVAESLGVDCIKRRTIKGSTKEEMRLSAAMVFLKQSSSRQVHEHIRNNHGKGGGAKHIEKTLKCNIAKKPFISNSCRGLVKALGLKGAITGSRILRRLEKLKLITIERINEELCSAETYWQKIIEYQEKENPINIESYCFEKNGLIWIRRRSNITVL
jgi:hypothetical protein